MVLFERHNKKKSTLLLGFVIICFLSLLCLILRSSSTSALTYSSDLDVNFTLNPTISIQLSSPSDLVISELAPGSYADSNIITVGVNTNSTYGYQLSATVGSKNGTDALVNSSNSNYTFRNLTSGASSLSSFGDNTWGYSYCYSTAAECREHSEYWVYGNRGSAFSGYGGLPLDNNTDPSQKGKGGVVLINPSSLNDPNQTDSISFKIGARASVSQASGSYSNTINFYAVANAAPQLGPMSCEANKICYFPNSLDPVEGTMAKHGVVANDEVILRASNYSRREYGFAGWNTRYDYTGTFYGPNETITVPPEASYQYGMSLYAVWVPSAGDLQSWSGCPSLARGAVTALKDVRDNQVYAVAKLADGNCWMIENLRLNHQTSSGTYANMAQGFSTGFTGLASPDPLANFGDVTTANSLYSTDGSTVNTISGSYLSDRFPRYDNSNTTSRDSNSDGINRNTYSYGNYYTWSAALANTDETYGDNVSIQNSSICPTGWSLPTGGDNTNTANSDFWKLSTAIVGAAPANASTEKNAFYAYNEGKAASEAYRSYPNNFINSGLAFNGDLIYRGDGGGGYYWASTYSGPMTAYMIDFNGYNVYPGSSSFYKHYGRSVRCMIHNS